MQEQEEQEPEFQVGAAAIVVTLNTSTCVRTLSHTYTFFLEVERGGACITAERGEEMRRCGNEEMRRLDEEEATK